MKLQAMALAVLVAFAGAAFAQTSTAPSTPAQDQVKADKDQLKQAKKQKKDKQPTS